jgi:protein-ribulosamine 3-kinase
MHGGEAGWQAAATAAIGESLGVALGAPRWSPCGASSLNATWRLHTGGVRFFVKVNAATRLPMFEAEADGLIEIARANAVRVPRPIAYGACDGAAFLALEWLDFAGGGRDADLGRALANLHRTTAPRFGWKRDNTIGTTPQTNTWIAEWATFFRDCRIAPQLALAARNGHGTRLQRDGETLLAMLPALLGGHAPAPSVLHGDLWSGNAARLETGEPVIFDPAVYFGDREADLAMTELFGGFGADFYAAYREASPLPDGYELRRTLYNLYQVLNHLNLFGGGYLGQAEAMIGSLLSRVK